MSKASQRIGALNPSIATLTIYMLGRFAVYRGETPIEDPAWQRQKAKKLFKLLSLSPQHQLLKDRALELLWPDKTPEAATNNLHRTLFILRRVLEPGIEHAAQSPYIQFKDEILTLNPATIAWIDAEAFERLIQLGHQQHHNLDHYRAALELYKGEFLPEDLYEVWAEDRRSALQKSYVDLLKQVAAIYVERAAYQEAINSLCALLRVEPTDEGVQRELMRLYVQTGERHKALRLYQHSRRALHEELGVEPSARTTALYEAILRERIPTTIESTSLQLPIEEQPAIVEEANRIPLVGRQAEMQELIEHLRQAQRGHGGVALLIGEQGVGKTRIGEELAAYARTIGIRTLYGAAFEGEGRLLYAPFVETIRKGLDPQMLDRLRERLGPLADDLSHLLPELASAAPTSHARPDAEINRLAIDTGDQERRRLFDAIAATYTIFAQSRPLLVFLDNLHAASESSLQLLHYLARQIANRRILIVCAVEQDKLQRGAPITLIFGELQRNNLAQRLNLRRLNQDEVTQVCAHLLDDSVRDSNIPRSVYELTEGNPFFVKALVLSLTRAGKLKRRAGGWQLLSEAGATVPASVQEMIGVRLGHLSNDAYRLLGVAAVIGNGFSYELLQATTQWKRGMLLDAFDEILRDALVEAAESGYRFQHAMIRQVVYSELSAERRAWLHEQVASALESLAAQQLDEQATVLAHHYEYAGDTATAFRYLVRAGDWAHGAYALRESLEHYNHALELYRRHSGIADADALFGLLERRSLIYLALSDFDSAIGDLEQLLQTYQDAGQHARSGETLYQIGFAHYWAHRLIKATMYLDQALEIAESLDYAELRSRVLGLRDILNSTQGSIADRIADEAELLAEKTHPMPAEEHWGYAMLAHLRYDFVSAQRHAQSCIAVGESMSNTFLTLGGYFVLAMSQASLGDYQIALGSLFEALKLSETAGDRFWRARLLNTVGWVYRDLFSLDLAVQYDRASLDLARDSTPRLTEAEGNALANLATTYLLLDQYEPARAYLNEGLAFSASEPFMRWRYLTRLLIVQGQLALIAGQSAEAWEAMEQALALARSTKARKNIARACLLRGSVLMATGAIDHARAAMRHALSIADSLNNPGMIWPCHVALAQLEDADRRPEAAALHYHAAQEIIERIASRLTDTHLRECFLNAARIRI
jgi:DNA-binding SARP family transcriptional activator/tetratricopeptide (TPR) repeat protein